MPMTPRELKRRRVAAGLTQAQVGALIDVSTNTVARWERGEVRIVPAMGRLLDLTLPPAPRSAAKKEKKHG
jgi:transcriptional regulator with XRE-family HTH domain